MKQNIFKIILWAVVLLWMTWIFSLSAQTANESKVLSGQTIRVAAEMTMPEFQKLSLEQQSRIISKWQNLARKSAHVLLYLVLGLLCMTVLLQYPLESKVRIGMALGISISYAVVDELHQFFVNGRSCRFTDVCIDALGALVGILLVRLVQRARCKFRKESLEG